MPKPATTAIRESATGYYQVELLKRFVDEEFVYRPSADMIRVDAELLARMQAQPETVGAVVPE